MNYNEWTLNNCDKSHNCIDNVLNEIQIILLLYHLIKIIECNVIECNVSMHILYLFNFCYLNVLYLMIVCVLPSYCKMIDNTQTNSY